MRINELARKHGLTNREIIDYLTRIGVPGKSHSSALDEDLVGRILGHFKKKTEPEAEIKPSKFKRVKRVRPRPEALELGDPADSAISAIAAGVETPSESATPPEPAIAAELGQDISAAAEPGIAGEPGVAPAAPTTVLETGETIRMTPSGPVVVGPDGVHEPIPATTGRPQARETAIQEPPARAGSAPAPPTMAPEPAAAGPGAGTPQEPSRPPVREGEPDKTNEALRREIQKLKKKRMRTATPAGAQPAQPQVTGAPPGRRGPQRGRGGRSRDGGRGKRAWRREKRDRLDREIQAAHDLEIRERTIVKVHDATTVADVASALGVSANLLIGKLITMGVMATVNQRLDHDAIELVAAEYGFQIEKVDLVDDGLLAGLQANDVRDEDKVSRSPIVTIMGHVDHGKTKLLDRVRRSDIVAGEAGGITQHIGAYQVKAKRGTITFLDTPGHAAFTAMRARGAMVTDIVILVVAADDSVMPQTLEALHHAKAAGVPIIVAINKIDKPSANPDRVKQDLTAHDLLVEDWGGEVQCFPISALEGTGVDALLDGVLLQSEMLELKASPKCKARGTIVEARREEGRGTIATVLIQEGTLRVGDPFVSGLYSGRIRSMQDDRGRPVEAAGPGRPVEVTGLQDVPTAGDPFAVVEDDSQARQIAIKLQQAQRLRDMKKAERVTLDHLHSMIEAGELKELHLIVKADVQGSVEALVDSLSKVESEKVSVVVLHSGVGAVSDSDVMLASASNALIVGFNVRPQPSAMVLSKQESVEIICFNVIYQAIDAIRGAMTGLLDRAFKENVLGRCQVMEVFRVTRSLSIAGCQVNDGKISRNRPIRVLRDSVVVHEGTLASLKRFKEDVPEVQNGFECGIGIERFNDIRVGDEVECFELEEVAPTL